MQMQIRKGKNKEMEAAALATRVAALEAELALTRSAAPSPVPGEVPGPSQAPHDRSLPATAQRAAPGAHGDSGTSPPGDRGDAAAEELWRGKVEGLQAERDAALSGREQAEKRAKQLEQQVLSAQKLQQEEQEKLQQKLEEQRRTEDRLQRELSEVRSAVEGGQTAVMGLSLGICACTGWSPS